MNRERSAVVSGGVATGVVHSQGDRSEGDEVFLGSDSPGSRVGGRCVGRGRCGMSARTRPG